MHVIFAFYEYSMNHFPWIVISVRCVSDANFEYTYIPIKIRSYSGQIRKFFSIGNTPQAQKGSARALQDVKHFARE